MNANFKSKIKRVLTTANIGYAVPLTLEEKLWHLQHDPNWKTLDLPIQGSVAANEEVMAEKVGENRYRVAASPGMLQGLAADDVIALDADSPAGFRLLERGDNVCIHLFCDAGQRAQIRADLEQILGRIGGRLDGTMGETGLCFTISVAAGFTAIEGALRRVVGDEWAYSNVLDEDGEPLNWWLKDAAK